jgi:predicted Zn-dependent protease
VFLARALAGERRRGEAEVRFREALAVAPSHGPALLGLAELLATCPRDAAAGAEALALAERARESSGAEPGTLYWSVLAKAHAAAGQHAEARLAARRAVALARRLGDPATARSLVGEPAFWREGVAYCPVEGARTR